MAKMSGSQAIIEALLLEGIDTVYGYPGGAIMPIYDLLYDYEDKIHHVLVRHEQGGAHAAQGFAQTSGKVGVCFGTSGPGATNLLTGIANAMLDSVPMVFISAQVVSPLLGTDAFQEIDMIGLSMPITKWNLQITKSEDIPAAMAKAFYIANTGRKGPVLLDITKDAQLQEVDFTYKKNPHIRSYTPHFILKDEEIKKASEFIIGAKRPLILAGHGITLSGAEKELIELAEKIEAPVASTLLGLSAFPSNHRLNVGMLGMHGHYSPNKLTNEADVIIAIGMRFDDRVTGNLSKYAPDAKIVHLEIDNAELNKIKNAIAPVHGDAKEAIKAILQLIEKSEHKEWLAKFRELDKDEFDKVIKYEVNPQTEKIRMGELVSLISEKTKGEAVIVTDVGQHQMFAARYYEFNTPNSFITSGGLGTMGFGLPAAIGAKMGDLSREVILFAGDGGFQMNIQELGTIQQEKIAVKMVVLNNHYLGMVRQWQELFNNSRYSSTPITSPEFVKVADAYGIKGKRVINREDLDQAVQEMLDCKESYLLEVFVENEGNVFPMIVPGASVAEIRLS